MNDRPSLDVERLSALPPIIMARLRPRVVGPFVVRVLVALLVVAIFLAFTCLSIIVHLNAPPTRRVVRDLANRGLLTLLEGRIEVGPIDRLGLRHATIREARIVDPEGYEVIVARDIDARIETWALVKDLVWSDAPEIRITIPRARIEEASVTLIEDERHVPSLARTFLPRDPAPGSSQTTVVIDIPKIEIGRARATGHVGIPIDAEATRIGAAVLVDTSSEVSVHVRRTGLVVRKLIPAELRGGAQYDLYYDLRAPDIRREEPGRGDDRLTMAGSFAGSAALASRNDLETIPVVFEGTMDGLDLVANVDLPKVGHRPLRAIFPWLPIHEDVTLRARVFGPLPEIRIVGDGVVGKAGIGSAIRIDGALGFSDKLRLSLGLDVEGLDARVVVPEAPEARVTARSTIDVMLTDPAPAIRLAAAASSIEAFGRSLPPVDAAFVVIDDQLVGGISVWDPAVEIEGRVRVAKDGVFWSALFGGSNIEASPWVGDDFAGAVTGRVDGRWKDGALFLSGIASVRGLRAASLSAARATANIDLSGPLDHLNVFGNTTFEALRTGNETLGLVGLTFRGPVGNPSVGITVRDGSHGNLDAGGILSVADRRLSSVRFDLSQAGEHAKGTLQSLALGTGGEVRVDGVTVEEGSVGSMKGSIQVTGQELIGRFDGQGVDLTKLSRLVGLPLPVEGIANVKVDVERTRSGRRGTVDVELESGKAFGTDGISARLSARMRDEEVEASGYLRLIDEGRNEDCEGAIAELRFANGSAKLAGPILSAATWKRATGSADVTLERVNLGCLLGRVPKERRPVEALGGWLDASFHVDREAPHEEPSFRDFVLRTEGLTAKANGFESDKLDLQIEGNFDGDRGSLALAAALFDHEMLARVELTLSTRLAALAEHDWYHALRNAPLTMALTVPSRTIPSLASLPAPLRDRVPSFSGDLSAKATFEGTLAAPNVFVTLQAFDVEPTQENPYFPPVNLDLAANYDPTDGSAIGGVSVAVAHSAVALVSTAIQIDPAQLTTNSPSLWAWQGRVSGEFFDFPLQSLPAIGDLNIRGGLKGRVDFLDLHKDPTVKVALTIPELVVEEAKVKVTLSGDVAKSPLSSDAAEAEARLAILLEDEGGGRLQALGFGDVRWDDLVVPRPNWDGPGRMVMGAVHFPITPFFPLVSGAVTKLEGRLDGSAEIEWGALSNAAGGHLKSANLRVDDVVAYVPQLGQELRGGHATLRATPRSPDGSQSVLVEEVEAHGISGRIHGYGTANLVGLILTEATGFLGIDEGEELPITIEGVPLGKARGEARFTVVPSQAGLDLAVDVSKVRIDLPQASSRDVQPLDENPTIIVRPANQATALRRSDSSWRYELDINLEDVEVRSSSMDLTLRTLKDHPLRLLLSDRLHATGDILLAEGNLSLNKKQFEIDEGLIRLRDEDTSNPYINMTAHWESLAATRVYVDYVGLLRPISDDKIRFRSDPPRTQDEIIQLLVFGEGEANATNLAGGVIGGNVATGLVNDLVANAFGGVLRDVLALNVGTTDTGGGYVAAQVNLSSFTFGGSVEQVQQGASTSTSGKTGGCGDFFFDYKITRRWSLRGSGAYCDYEEQSTGASNSQDGISLGLDVLWQLRY